MPSQLPNIFSTNVQVLLDQGLSQQLHWFPEDVPVSRLAAVMVGMANGKGGTILLGVSPRSGQVQGIRDPEMAMDKVFQAALLADPSLVLPLPSQVKAGGDPPAELLMVSIPHGLPNVYSLDGSYLGRQGRQTNPLSARQLRQLLIERGAVQFESRLPDGAAWDDLDPEQVQRYYDDLNLTVERGSHGDLTPAQSLLVRRGCLKRQDGKLRPTYAGLLLFGRYPEQWLPGASILAAHFAGPTYADQFIKQEISGTLSEQLRRAEAFVRENLRTQVRLVGLRRQEGLEYPLEAVRELLVNAVAHRDYNLQGDTIHLNIFSDRLEIQSPGALPGPVNLENLLEARFSRNAVIAQVLSDMGYVERLGYGLDRVVAVVRENNLPAPNFDEVAGCFRVTLYNNLSLPESKALRLIDLSAYEDLNLNPRQQRVLSYLAEHKRINSAAYQELCPEVHPESLRRDLAELVRKGILLKVGDKRSTYYILK